jgi:hypothetical protein
VKGILCQGPMLEPNSGCTMGCTGDRG